VPEDMDGRVLQSLFEPAFLEQNPVRASGSADSKAGKWWC